MTVAIKIPIRMSVDEFLAWCPEDGQLWQLVDGEPMAMAPASGTHSMIQSETARLLGNHLLDRGSQCRVGTAPGIKPKILTKQNVRVPDLAITCSPETLDDGLIHEPVLVIEILSPSNRAETWANVWAYTSIPSVREILIVSSLEITAELLRRGPDGAWPESPAFIRDADLTLETIRYRGPLADFYRTTHLHRPG